MSGEQESQRKKPNKPPSPDWKATKPFFDMRLSHWIQGFLALALLSVAIVQAAIYFTQAGIMRDQLTEMRGASRQTDQTIAALKGQADIMRGQLEVSRDEFNATQRPWISIDFVRISSPLFFLDSGDIGLSLQYSMTNSGRTPGNVTLVIPTYYIYI